MSDSKPNSVVSSRPTMCRSCGAIVGAGGSECGVCGAPVGASQRTRAPVAADRETLRFARAVLTRPYKFTVVFLVMNFFIFLLMWESSGMSWSALWEFPFPVLIAYGAKLNYLINERQEWWRFVTPIFIHVNLPHVLINMYSLWMVGPYVEKLYGSAKFVVFWVVTGIAGVTASYLTVSPSGEVPLGALGRFLFKMQDVPSAGASGALFGLVGVLFVFGIKFRHELPEGFKRAFGTGMLPIILINLFIGYLGRGVIDNAAHLGGLISGAALALVVQYRRPGERATITASWYVLQVAALLLLAVSFFKVAQHFKDPVSIVTSPQVPEVAPELNAFLQYSQAMNQAQETLNEVMHGNTDRVDGIVKSLESVPHLDQKADELRERLKVLLQRAKTEGSAVAAATPGKKTNVTKKAFIDDVIAWKKEYNQWLQTTGRNY